MRLSKKHGLQPCIPLCPCCGKPKAQVALLGSGGDKLAKAMGAASGEMPMYARLPGDVELCEECKKKGIEIVEIAAIKKGKKTVHQPTGRFFLVSENFLNNVTDETLRERIREHRMAYVDKETADWIEGYAREKEEGATDAGLDN